MTILFIVESPGKIAKISKILGKNYLVKASVGHFRDLDNKSMSIDFENNFEPIYVITKPDVVKNLKSAMRNCDMVYIASDLDKEGEAIGQHLYDVLKPSNYKRLVFNAITKEAILNSIKNAGKINKDLVNAQKARRILDRLYGYLISPILQKQIGGSLSAGRVQSVAAKIVIDKENEIKQFMENNENSTYFKINGIFSSLKAGLFEATDKEDVFETDEAYNGKTAQIPLLNTSNPNTKVINFMKKCLKSQFMVHSVGDKISIRHPSPPFETSTLQQEANRKFGMSVDTTMKIAQKLYEGGYITYMRTDSVEISPEGHKEIKKVIEDQYGKEYYQKTVYKNKSANAQEAHEAIRPTHPDLLSLENEVSDELQIKLYKLIWQRTIASQMKPAKVNITTIQINISKYIEEKIDNPFYYFQSQIEKIIFPGFMKVYIESVDDAEDDETMKDFKGKIPKKGDKLTMEEIIAKQEYKRPPPRYSEASLVKTLKKLGIGRPSTYVNTIKTIMAREYIKIGNIPGVKKEITTYTIRSENKKHIMQVFEENGTVQLGKENKKIIPTNLGITVNDFLVENFSEMMDYKFTAKMEEELDAISNGEKVWYKVVKKFHDKLAPIVEEWSKKKGMTKAEDKLLGTDSDGNEIFATKTKYGPAVKKQIDGKFVYAKISEPLTLEKIKLKDAVKLFEYPKQLGKHDGKDILLHKGQYGFYLSYDKQNYSISDDKNSDLSLKEAIKIIQAKKANNIAEFVVTENKKKIKATVLNGQYGPYIQVLRGKKKINYPVPRNLDPTKLTDEKVLDIISGKKSVSKGTKKTYGGSKTKKNTTKTKVVKKTIKN
ncbi:topoisomerase I [Tupanvirus deep ocean]|uniref:Topoisomerase I n=2 Tax=Tupanvirus TaxID=2094720 RepID=A0AC62A9B3_9VIRU|nr:topoisomerase I [Tupanvirus deep ocean]QKU34314.1 topoisomerase I [Tupanvirus deep ocean]